MHGFIMVIGRNMARSAVGAAAYRSAARYIDLRTGATYDFATKCDVLAFGVLGWAGGAESLWNSAEDAEPMPDAIVAREAVLRVPATLDLRQSIELCRTYAETLRRRHGVAVHWAVHAQAPADATVPSGVVALVGITVRKVSGNRFGMPVRGLHDARYGRSTMLELRHAWLEAMMDVVQSPTPGRISVTDPASGRGKHRSERGGQPEIARDVERSRWDPYLDLLARELTHLRERRRPPLPQRRSAVERALAWRRLWTRRDQHGKPDQPN
jgi:hypothetical protein